MHQSESAAPSSAWHVDRGQRWLAIGAVVAFFFLMLRTGWVSDDAFITSRVADNVVHGHGLRWNVDERVQAFAHPLWALLLSSVHALTHEAFFTTLALSVLLSMGAVVCVALSASSPLAGVAAIIVLMVSRSFVDFSTGGLDNPLAHLLLAWFVWQYTKARGLSREVFLSAGLLALTRIDLLLLVAPALAAMLRGHARTRGWRAWAAVGFAPVAGWLVFSLFYFGYPLPNAVYAHLGAGVSLSSSLARGIRFLLAELTWDPVGVWVLLLSAGLALAVRRERELLLCAGVWLYLAYVVITGGDGVHGRLLTPAIFVSVTILASACPALPSIGARAGVVTTLLAAAVLGFLLQTNEGFRARADSLSALSLLDDRKRHQELGSVELIARSKPMPQGDDVNRGHDLARRGAVLEVASRVGYLGYIAGPGVHVIDRRGRTDAFLARLPASPRASTEGFAARTPPAGYAESLESGRCALVERELCPYYDAQRLVISGPLWSASRLRALFELYFGIPALPEPAGAVSSDAS